MPEPYHSDRKSQRKQIVPIQIALFVQLLQQSMLYKQVWIRPDYQLEDQLEDSSLEIQHLKELTYLFLSCLPSIHIAAVGKKFKWMDKQQ